MSMNDEAFHKIRAKVIAKKTVRCTGKKKAGITPEFITVQLVKPNAANPAKYERVASKVFVDFEFPALNLLNIRQACEQHFEKPTGSSTIMKGLDGPVCWKDSHLTNQKVFYVHFNTGAERPIEKSLYGQGQEISSRHIRSEPSPKKPRPAGIVIPPSLSIADLLRAGKLAKPKLTESVTLTLETFEIGSGMWCRMEPATFKLEKVGPPTFVKV